MLRKTLIFEDNKIQGGPKKLKHNTYAIFKNFQHEEFPKNIVKVHVVDQLSKLFSLI